MKKKTPLRLEELLDFEFDEIDKYKLDEEWRKQEKLVGSFTRALADARRNVDIAKSELDVKEAVIDRKIRKNPEKYGVARTTEGSIERVRTLELSKTDEPINLINARHDMAIIQGAVDRLHARGKAISDLIYLHGLDYFAQPKQHKLQKQEDFDRIKNRKVKGVRDE